MKAVLMGVMTLAAAAQGENCITVTEPRLSFADNNISAAMIQWHANLENQCRKTLDTDLTIQLLNEKEEVIYEFVEQTTVGVEEHLGIDRDVYVPSRI